MHMRARHLYLFDTFEGLPAPTAADPDFERAKEWTGKCRGTVDEVTALLARFGIARETVTLVPGLFQDTLIGWNRGPIALLHLDGDWYESIRTSLSSLWPHVAPGGIVQIDDYGIWEGCRRAVDEFLAEHRLEREVRPVDGGAVWIRKPR